MKPVFLAPMAGITDKPFRQMVRKFGNQTLFTEMIGCETLIHGHRDTLKMADLSGETNVIAQLVGANPEHMAEAAHILTDNGITALDINMGCPVKKLISNCSGAKLMLFPDKAAEIVSSITQKVSVPVSVKMRLGWDETRQNAVDFAKTVESAGATGLTVHGRTKAQGYAGVANWYHIAEVKNAVSVPVIANGDIVDNASAEQALQITHADGLMVGRGALGKPWILTEIETGIKPEFNLTDIVLEHLDLMLDYYGLHGLLVARKHLAWYARGKKGVASFCQRVYAEQNVSVVKDMIRAYFDDKED